MKFKVNSFYSHAINSIGNRVIFEKEFSFEVVAKNIWNAFVKSDKITKKKLSKKFQHIVSIVTPIEYLVDREKNKI